MGFIQFIFTKKFLVNVGIAVLVAVFAAVGLFFWLDSYTEHGVTVEVPDFTGVPVAQIAAFADTTDIEFEVVDSLYSSDLPRGAVADQEPKPGYRVKRGRKVYLTVNAVMPRQVVMPDVHNLSLRQAKAVLESVGLQLGNLEYRPDIAKNAVLDQKIGGRSVQKGKNVFVNTVVDLVLGDGLSNTRVPVPYLLYYRLEEAVERLNAFSLNLGTFRVDTPFTDTSLVRVYRQIPEFREGELLPMGSSVILYFTGDTASIKYDTALYSKALPPLDSLLLNVKPNDDDFEEGDQ
ncbi:MAG: PASTA domain-containing protein [Flavobacteriales bacterium]|nr:PASTA domain-containing protein [Flavobacteriales bacterium]